MLVLFNDVMQSGCGVGRAEVGPFIRSADQKVYLDVSFFDELAPLRRARRLRAGVRNRARGRSSRPEPARDSDRVRARRARLRRRPNGSARCDGAAGRLPGRRVGVHANGTERLLEPGDVEEGLAPPRAIGDDRLQARHAGP